MSALFRCSSLGRIMTEPKTQKEGPLSVGAKTYVRELAMQDILGVDFSVSSKAMQKGTDCEQHSIDLLNWVQGTALMKNTERRSNGFIVGECDLFNAPKRRGHDLKTSWSAQTFPGWSMDCVSALYEWQCRGYMWLWDADEWQVNYALVDTPEELIGYEPLHLHIVSHIPERLRLTTWTIQRDAEKERAIETKVIAAREYYKEVIADFETQHTLTELK